MTRVLHRRLISQFGVVSIKVGTEWLQRFQINDCVKLFKMIVNCDDEERITKGCELRCNLFRHKSWADTLQALSHPPAPWLEPASPNLNGTNEAKIMNFLGQKWAGNNGLFWVQFLGSGSPPHLFTEQEVEAYLPGWLLLSKTLKQYDSKLGNLLYPIEDWTL